MEPSSEIESKLLPEEKFAVVKKAIAAAEKTGAIITGSLARTIWKLGGEGELKPEDIREIGDVDLATLGYKKEVEALAQTLTRPGFPVEISSILFDCAYNPKTKSLAFSKIKLVLEDQKYEILCATPEFLLLSLVDSDVSEKTPPGKYKKKVLEIQRLPGFSKENFITLASHEIKARKRLNSFTFKTWKNSLLEEARELSSEEFLRLLKLRYPQVASLVNQAELFNRVKRPEDLESLSFGEVREILNLEKFLAELTSQSSKDKSLSEFHQNM